MTGTLACGQCGQHFNLPSALTIAPRQTLLVEPAIEPQPTPLILVNTAPRPQRRLQASGWFSRSFATVSGGLLAVLAVGFGGCLLAVLLCAGMAEVNRPASPPASKSGLPSKVTYANFRRIRQGMTRREVVRILGSGYTVPLEMDLGDADSVVLQWNQGDSRVIQITFVNGIVSSRFQIGLD